MTAVGDADIAITRQSYVAKYLENNFPAYVIMPNEGTPINLYGAAISKDNRNPRKAIEFIEWLIDSQDAKIISQSIDTGFNFIVCQDKKAASLAPEQMWLNTNYIQKAQQEALVSHWVENVRFSVKN
jgi:ABC-type Fe3+ transport system substrate-binding protein